VSNLPFMPLSFVEPSRAAPGAGREDAAWYADGDPQESESIATHNQAAAARLCAAIPGLAAAAEPTADALNAVFDPGLPPEALLRRLQRRVVLLGPWGGGEAAVTLADGVAWLELALPPGAVDDAPGLARKLAALIGRVADATGFLPWAQGAPASPEQAAGWLLLHDAPRVRQAAKQARRAAILAPLAWPLAVLFGVLALLLGGIALFEGVRDGTPVVRADPTLPNTFITEAALPTRHEFGILPRYELVGRIGREQVVLPVSRDMAIRAGPGAGFTVVPTRDPAVPWLPQVALAEAGAVIAIGDFGLDAEALVLAALPIALWLLLVAWPLWRAPDARARAAFAGGLLALCAAGAAAFAIGFVL
jgi:hypothetical protein